jgi:molybdenum cofactor guanylyltransferase
MNAGPQLDPSRLLTAVLLGGRSSRMGRDKFRLRWHGQPLWHHQVNKVAPFSRRAVCLSGRAEQRADFPADLGPVCQWVADAEGAAIGPLGGLAACLALLAPGESVLVLAVDVPGVQVDTLLALVQAAAATGGAVPRRPEAGHYWEPLVAVYPAEMREIAEQHIAQGQFSLQALCQRGFEAGLLREFVLPLGEETETPFANLNTPAEAELYLKS